jgi:hypothetical protein
VCCSRGAGRRAAATTSSAAATSVVTREVGDRVVNGISGAIINISTIAINCGLNPVQGLFVGDAEVERRFWVFAVVHITGVDHTDEFGDTSDYSGDGSTRVPVARRGSCRSRNTTGADDGSEEFVVHRKARSAKVSSASSSSRLVLEVVGLALAFLSCTTSDEVEVPHTVEAFGRGMNF